MIVEDTEQESLFSTLVDGVQTDGSILVGLGWDAASINSATGIEPVIGLFGFGSEQQFMDWIKTAVGSDLADWEPCSVELFFCWFPPLSEQYPHLCTDGDGPDFCYSAWRSYPDLDAVKVQQVTVFALRHKASALLLKDGRSKAFHCARQRSYAEAMWMKEHPTVPVSPQIMYDNTSEGFYLTGIKQGDEEESHLTWPSADLVDTLRLAAEFSKQGAHEIQLCEGDVGFELAGMTAMEKKRLLHKYREYGEDALLVDLVSDEF